jgi:cyclopropane fatty-acyl-phospholipid synthase-like methyltransferase
MTNSVLNKNKIEQFWHGRAKEQDPRIATHFKQDAALDYDVALIKQYLPPNARVLDLGCGTGAISNQIASSCSYIRAIDKVDAFLKHCNTAKHISVGVGDIAAYLDQDQYDVIIIFGVMNYVEEHEASAIYANCHQMLKSNGKLIVKNACGVTEDVIVDKFSHEINDWYHAVYRFHEKEQSLLHTHFSEVKQIDIYPPELNRWTNTHFYAFVASK